MGTVGRDDRAVHLPRPAGQEAEGAGDNAADVPAAGVILAVGRERRGRDRRVVCDAPVPGTRLDGRADPRRRHAAALPALLESQGEIFEDQGWIMRGGIIVDATTIAEPSPVKNASSARDPDMLCR